MSICLCIEFSRNGMGCNIMDFINISADYMAPSDTLVVPCAPPPPFFVTLLLISRCLRYDSFAVARMNR